MDKKTELRARAKELRKTLDMVKVSALLCEKIRNNEIYKTSKNVMLFYPMKNEVDLRGLLTDNKNFYLPRVFGRDLEVCPYKLGDKLQKSEFGVSEPVSDKVNPVVLDLVIVPALMADKNGYRLGYGGGFYDRFLAGVNAAKTICVIPKDLLVDELPHSENDIKIDIIIAA